MIGISIRTRASGRRLASSGSSGTIATSVNSPGRYARTSPARVTPTPRREREKNITVTSSTTVPSASVTTASRVARSPTPSVSWAGTTCKVIVSAGSNSTGGGWAIARAGTHQSRPTNAIGQSRASLTRPPRAESGQRTPEDRDQNATSGTSAAPSSASKYSRSSNPNTPANRFPGKRRISVRYTRTESL